MWGNVDRIILWIEAQIDFDSKTTDLYDPQYCSKEYEDCSLPPSRFIRELVIWRNHLDMRMGLNHTVHPLMDVYLSWKIVFSLYKRIREIYFHHLEMNSYLHQEIFHWKVALLFIHWNRRIYAITILDVSYQVIWCSMT